MDRAYIINSERFGLNDQVVFAKSKAEAVKKLIGDLVKVRVASKSDLAGMIVNEAQQNASQ